MKSASDRQRVSNLRHRQAPLDMDPAEFRELGHRLVDQIAQFLNSISTRPVTRGETVEQVRRLIDFERPIPEKGGEADRLLESAANLVFDHSLHNGHPRFWGYITSSAAPLGALAELLAAAVNPNLGGWKLSPLGTEIESQTVRWIAELIGYPSSCGGVLVSGGNMANFIGFLVGSRTRAGWDIRSKGIAGGTSRLRVYASAETHTWVQKAVDLFGLGTDSLVWVPVDHRRKIDLRRLTELIEEDRQDGNIPFMVVGTAGSVSTGAVDPLADLAAIAKRFDLWFHVDGAYGGMAAQVEEAPDDLRALELADSVAIDPHKWLYAPLEAGCALVRQAELLPQTFSFHPPYYHLDPDTLNYFDLGLQNSRGFRALKIWLAFQRVGRDGHLRMIGDDILLAEAFYDFLEPLPDFERFTVGLSIVTFRYVPPDLRDSRRSEAAEKYLNDLNQEILTRLETGGEAFLSNAILDGKFTLRLCIVNFRTSLDDLEALPPIIRRVGEELDGRMRSS